MIYKYFVFLKIYIMYLMVVFSILVYDLFLMKLFFDLEEGYF